MLRTPPELLPSGTSSSSCMTSCSAFRSPPNSPDVEAAYRFFVDVMTRGREAQDTWFEWWRCEWYDNHFLLEGILDGTVVERENEHGHRYYRLDWDRVDAFMRDIDFSDPHYTAQAWVVVLAAMMMDYRYLYLN